MSGLCCPGTLPALSVARSVPSVPNPKRIQLLLLSSSGGPIWLTNKPVFLMRKTPPQISSAPVQTPVCIFPHICLPIFFRPEAYLSHLSIPPLLRAPVSIFLRRLISVPVHSFHTVYISLLSLTDSHSPTVCRLLSFFSIHHQLY